MPLADAGAPAREPPTRRSEVVLDERQRSENLDFVLLRLHDLHGLGTLGHPPEINLETLQLRVVLLPVVLLHALQEGLVAARLPQVLEPDVETLPHLAVTNYLRDLHADTVAVDVEHDPSTSMVESVGHALLDGSVHHYVDVISALEHRQITRNTGHALALVLLRELLPRAMAVTPRLRASIPHLSPASPQADLLVLLQR